MELLPSKDEKKEIEPFLLSNAFNVYNLKALGHFDTWRLDIAFLIFLRHFVPKYISQNIQNNLVHKDLI